MSLYEFIKSTSSDQEEEEEEEEQEENDYQEDEEEEEGEADIKKMMAWKLNLMSTNKSGSR